MKRICFLLSVLAGVSCTVSLANDALIVQDGQPRAEIVIAADPPRTVRLAAAELQTYVEKISGARLPIVQQPDERTPVKIFVGQSPHTDRLQVSADGLKHGAYRIVSGEDWLVLIGGDSDFAPIDPWPRNNADWVSGRVHAQWDEITGAHWGNPMAGFYKHYTGRASDIGKPPAEQYDKSGTVHVWDFDERGSFNAVCGFLHSLGVRWYMPGELGEVVPSMATILLPVVDQTVVPDFAVRRFNIRFGVHGRDTAMWAMRLGMRDPYGLQIPHGMHTMTHRPEILEAHPEWFALYGGKRHNQPGQRLNQLCYSNDELFQETVRYARAVIDHYRFDAVSVMPPDGYVAICQCPRCEGKETPERDSRGRLSDYVWDFVNRVAREVGKTHPGKLVANCAYGTYTLPPEKIDRLEPNVLVCIVGGRRPTSDRADEQDEIRRLREGWVAKTSNPVMVFENYPFTDRGWYLPSYLPRVTGAGINATKGISMGEDIWLSVGQDFPENAIGFNHFLVYFTARMYWGGPEQSVDDLFQEYCRLFYGPAEQPMRALFEYCEANWREMTKDKAHVDRTFELLLAAQQAVDADSVYGRRVALIVDYLEPLKNKGRQLAQQRGPVPQLRLARDAEGIVVDGRLDDAFWQGAPVHAVGHLRELQTGRRPVFGTTFQAAWGNDGHLYFAIRCDDRKGEPLNVGTARSEDQAIWYGDVVEILLETEAHSYYQIAVSPSGAMIDLDRGASRNSWYGWDSQAEVATQVADDHWTVEIRIPVVSDANDPLHQVIGRKPTSSLPWHFNICRQRLRDNGAEHSAFSPTGAATFHHPLKFAHLYDGQSHTFSADASQTDYLSASRAAASLASEGRHAEALAAWTELAAGKLTDLQKSDALDQAAASARAAQDFVRATDLADQIPLAPVADTVRMKNLLAMRKSQELIDRYRDEDFDRWPFWQAGEAFFARGRAWASTGSGPQAEADLVRALELTTEPRSRLNILLELGGNRESNLRDDTAALQAYQQIASADRNTGSATYFRGLEGAARMLRKSGKHDDALAVLGVVDLDKLRGYWRGSMHLALGETLNAAGRRDDARAVYRQLLADESVIPQHRQSAEAAIRAIGEDR